MAAKGTIVKAEITEQILALFPETAFLNGKEIRVDTIENGVPVQVKIVLSAVKNPVEKDADKKAVDETQFTISPEEKEDLEEVLREQGVKF